MNRDDRLRQSLKELAGELAIFCQRGKFFREIGDSNSEFFDRSRELACAAWPAFSTILAGPHKQIFNATPAEVVFKDLDPGHTDS